MDDTHDDARPLPTFDPERLRRERTSADLGSDEETGHDQLRREPGKAPQADDPLRDPTGGVSPPAR